MSENFEDISGQPVEPGDWIIVYNEESEYRYAFKIEEVTQVSPEIRKLRCTVMESNDPQVKKLQKTNLNLNIAVPTIGAIKRHREDGGFDALERAEVAMIELKRWLDSRLSDRLGARVVHCIKYLQMNNLFPHEEEIQAKRRLRALVKAHPKFFSSTGGYIFSTGVELESSVTHTMSSGSQTRVLVVDYSKLMTAMRLFLECGILGDVKLINV